MSDPKIAETVRRLLEKKQDPKTDELGYCFIDAALAGVAPKLLERIEELERALRFYARRQRWCAIDSGDDNTARRWLIGDNEDGHGYERAQSALKGKP